MPSSIIRPTPQAFKPWDPLELSTELTSGLRVQKASLALPLYRARRARLTWRPLLHNGFMVSGHLRRHLSLLEAAAKAASQEAGAISLEVYSWDEAQKGALTSLAEAYPALRYHPQEASLDDLLRGVLTLLQSLEADREALFLGGEPPGKKVQVLALLLGREEAEALKVPAALALVRRLLQEGPSLRFYPFLLLPEGFFSSLLPYEEEAVKALAETFSLTAALTIGDEEFLRESFPTLPEGRESIGQERIGLLRGAALPKLLPLHPWTFTPSHWLQERRVADAEEERLYRAFLASLAA